MARNNFDDHLTELLEDIEDLSELAEYHLDDISDWEAGDTKFDRAAELVRYHRSLKKMISDLEEMGAAFAEIREDLAGGNDHSSLDPQSKLRTITLTVTDGMIRNSMLTLSAGVRAGTMTLGEELVIHPPEGEPFKTVLLQPGNRLRERKRVRQFYEAESVSPGDTVILKETKPGTWSLINRPLPSVAELFPQNEENQSTNTKVTKDENDSD